MTASENMSGAHECGGDPAAFALGALEVAEAEAFERHLEDCAVCRDEVVALRRVVQALPMAAPQHPAPRRLRRRVLRTIAEESRPATPALPRRQAALNPNWIWRGLVAAGACAAIALAIFAGLDYASGGRVRLIRARVAGIAGSASVSLHGDRGELVVRHLPPPPSGEIYELWLKRPRSAPTPTSILFSVTSAGAGEVGLPSRLHGVTQIMVTPEPKGGSLVPTRSPVIVAPLT